uniref:Uncharacterized protein n=1 Tax=Lotus japonicus TaxID=34305 RepID=I3SNS1_LOTJA|nr:unknown [Lotus japonicus]
MNPFTMVKEMWRAFFFVWSIQFWRMSLLWTLSILSCLAFSVLKRLRLLQSPQSGINSIIDAALAPPGISGAYFFGGKGRTINSSALSRNAKSALELWETTSNLLSVTPFGVEGKS